MLGLAFLIALPLQPLVFYVVRLPLDGLVRAMLGLGKSWGMVALLYAPLTEEPAKWLPLAVPPVANALAPANAVPLALVIGLGFGIGEIWFLTHALVASPTYPDLPFWMFYGFAIERLEVCLLHGVLRRIPDRTAGTGRNVLAGRRRGHGAAPPHQLSDLSRADRRIRPGRAGWSIIVMGWVAALAVAGAIMLWRLHHRLLRGPG